MLKTTKFRTLQVLLCKRVSMLWCVMTRRECQYISSMHHTWRTQKWAEWKLVHSLRRIQATVSIKIVSIQNKKSNQVFSAPLETVPELLNVDGSSCFCHLVSPFSSRKNFHLRVLPLVGARKVTRGQVGWWDAGLLRCWTQPGRNVGKCVVMVDELFLYSLPRNVSFVNVSNPSKPPYRTFRGSDGSNEIFRLNIFDQEGADMYAEVNAVFHKSLSFSTGAVLSVNHSPSRVGCTTTSLEIISVTPLRTSLAFHAADRIIVTGPIECDRYWAVPEKDSVGSFDDRSPSPRSSPCLQHTYVCIYVDK